MSQPINTNRSASSRLLPILLLLAAIGLVAYFYWPKPDPSSSTPGSEISAPQVTASGATTANGQVAGSAAGAYAVDANGERLLNEAGLPYSAEPLPVAKPIPIRAAPSEVIGYTVDAQGVSKPIRAGELKAVPNTPGSFAVVDMWAEGGPTVVPATKGQALSQAELERLRAAEEASERAGRQ